MKRQVIEVLSGKGNTSALTTNDLFILVNETNIPFDVFVTGGTYSSGTATFTNNTGGTFNVSGFTNYKLIIKKIDLGNRVVNGLGSLLSNLFSILINTGIPFVKDNISNYVNTKVDFYTTHTDNKGQRIKIFWGTIIIDNDVITNISNLLTIIINNLEIFYNNGLLSSPVNFYCEHYLNLTPTNYSPTQVRLTNTLFNSLNPFKYSKSKSWLGISQFIRTNTVWNSVDNVYEKVTLKTISSDLIQGWVNYYDVSTSNDIVKVLFNIISTTNLYGNLSLTASTAILPNLSYDSDIREIMKNSVFVENLTNFYSKNKISINRNNFVSTSSNLLNNFYGDLLYDIYGGPKTTPIFSNSNTDSYPSISLFQYIDTYRILPSGYKFVIYVNGTPNTTLLNNLSYNNLSLNEKYIQKRDRDFIQVLPGYKEVYILDISVYDNPDTQGVSEFLNWIDTYSVRNDITSKSNPSPSTVTYLSNESEFNTNPHGPYMVIQSTDELMYELSINPDFTPTTSGQYSVNAIYKGYSFRPMIYPLNMNQITFEVPVNNLWNGSQVDVENNHSFNQFLTNNNINISNKQLRFIVKYLKLQEYDIITSDIIITTKRSSLDNNFITLTINDIKGGESLEQTIYKNIPNKHRKSLRPGSVEIYLSFYDIITGETSLVPNYKIIVTNYGDNEIFKLIKEQYVINNLFL